MKVQIIERLVRKTEIEISPDQYMVMCYGRGSLEELALVYDAVESVLKARAELAIQKGELKRTAIRLVGPQDYTLLEFSEDKS